MERIGLIPAAGTAARMETLPCSKEILPVPSMLIDQSREPGLGAVSENLITRLAAAGCQKIYWVIRPEKLDIISYYTRNRLTESPLAYLLICESDSVPRTLDFAYPYTKGKRIMMGFGDICLGAMDVFQEVEKRLLETKADATLGLFPVDDRETKSRSDMVEATSGGRIVRIRVKPEATNLKYCWALAVWQPSFTEFLHTRMGHYGHSRSRPGRELHLGKLFQDAVESGLMFSACTFENQKFIDIGTPASWQAAVSRSINLDQTRKDAP